MQETVNWSPKLIPFRGRRVESTVQQGRQTLVFGGRCSGKPKGKPWSLTRLAHQASPNDLVMCGISRAGPRHSFAFIKRLFSSSSLSDIRVVSCAYLRLLIFLLAILIPACASSRPVFLMMYSAYQLNKQGDNIQPWGTPFPIWNQSVAPCPVLTVAFLPAYRFLKRQVRWSGIPISFRIFHSLLNTAHVGSISQRHCPDNDETHYN